MSSVLILDYPVPSYGIRMFVTNFLPNRVILHAYSLEQAKMHIAQKDICLVIMDVYIPGGLDMEIIKIMRDLNEDLRILIFTEVDNQRYAQIYLNAGVSGFLYKSSSKEEYQAIIQQVMEEDNCSFAK